MLVGVVGFLGSEVVLSPVVSHCLRLSPFMWGVGGGWCGGGGGCGSGECGGGVGGGGVVKDGMKTTRNDSPAARDPIVNRTRSTSEITEDNTVKTTGNGSMSIGEVIMPRIRNGSGKDFMTTSKEN